MLLIVKTNWAVQNRNFHLAFRWDSLRSLFSAVWHLQNFSLVSILWTSLQSPANLPEITGNFNNNENDSNFNSRSIFDECYPSFSLFISPGLWLPTSAVMWKLFFLPILFIRFFLTFFVLLLPANKFTTWNCSYRNHLHQNCHCPLCH